MTGDLERIAAHPTAVSHAGSVGASASQRCPPDTRTAMTGKRKFIRTPYVFAMTKRLVILNAERERIRNSLERETDCHAPDGARNDRASVFRTPYGICNN